MIKNNFSIEKLNLKIIITMASKILINTLILRKSQVNRKPIQLKSILNLIEQLIHFCYVASGYETQIINTDAYEFYGHRYIGENYVFIYLILMGLRYFVPQKMCSFYMNNFTPTFITFFFLQKNLQNAKKFLEGSKYFKKKNYFSNNLFF